jgi:hypothetical protein
MLYTVTLLSRASNYSHRPAKSMSFASSPTTNTNVAVISFPSSWMNILIHSYEFSSPSAGENIIFYSMFSSSSMTITTTYPSPTVSSATQVLASTGLHGRNTSIPPMIRRLL